MRALIQVVQHASVTTEGEVIGSIGKGFAVLVGFAPEDTEETCRKVLNKMLKLRIFSDADGKTNCSLTDVGGSVLLVSQFTLYANCKKGNRPSFIESAAPDHATALYEYSIDYVRSQGFDVATGRFGADMLVDIANDGPFTIWLDSETL